MDLKTKDNKAPEAKVPKQRLKLQGEVKAGDSSAFEEDTKLTERSHERCERKVEPGQGREHACELR